MIFILLRLSTSGSLYTAMILILGPIGAGKSLLLKRLEEEGKSHLVKTKKKDKLSTNISVSSIEEADAAREKVPSTVPTIGTNICTASFGKSKDVTLKEVGGTMAPLWKSSYQDAEKVIYVIDISNPFQVACASILLRYILSSEDLQQTPILIVLNKIDNFCTVCPAEMKWFLGLDSKVANAPQPVTVIEASAKYSSGLQDIIEWISEST